jgi:putative FmdB family regulatory protein
MPIYTYKCDKCLTEKDKLVSIESRDIPMIHCNQPMKRIISIPLLVAVKKTANEMALDTLNSRESNHMSKKMKQMAFQGIRG